MGRGSGVDDLPVVGLEDLALLLGELALRVVEDEAGAQGNERRVDVDGIGVAGEVDGVDAALGVHTANPLHGLPVGREAVLDEEVLADAHHVRGVKQDLVLRGDHLQLRRALKEDLLRDVPVVVVHVVARVAQLGTRGSDPAEVRILVKVAAQDLGVGQILEEAGAEGHGRADDVAAHRQQDVARRHAAEHAARHEVRGHDGLVPLHGLRTVHLNAALLQLLDEVLDLGVGLLNRIQRTRTGHAAHRAVQGNLGLGRGLRGRDAAVIGATDDNVLQGVKIIPRVNNFRHNSYLPLRIIFGWRSCTTPKKKRCRSEERKQRPYTPSAHRRDALSMCTIVSCFAFFSLYNPSKIT